MGQIYDGFQSIAEERAAKIIGVEKIISEVVESVSDDSIQAAIASYYNESPLDGMTDEELDDLLNELPADAGNEKEEIVRVLSSGDAEIDIDDIVGVDEDDDYDVANFDNDDDDDSYDDYEDYEMEEDD